VEVHPEVRGQDTRGWQLVAGRKAPARDQPGQLLADLLAQRVGAAGIDVDPGRDVVRGGLRSVD
jgi:hypothetical protein